MHIEGIVSVFYAIAKYNKIQLQVDMPVDICFKENMLKINDRIKKYKDINCFDNYLIKECNKDNFKNNNGKIIASMTGGIDSLYTALSNSENIDSFLYVIGCDINYNLSNKNWIDKNINYIKEIIKKNFNNKKLIIIKTNLIIFLSTIMKKYNINTEFTYLTTGFSLYSCVINMKDYNKIIVPGPGCGFDKYLKFSKHIVYSTFGDIGSTSFFNISHDDDTRINKIKYIYGKNRELFNNLRVCINYGSIEEINCLKCSKCIRTSLICKLLKIDDHNLLKIDDKDIKLYLKYLENDNPMFSNQVLDLLNSCIFKINNIK